jgi:DNA-binding XRE family transcriptional regulator
MPNANHNFLEHLDAQLNQNPAFKHEWEAEAPYREVATACYAVRCKEDLTTAQMAKRLGLPLKTYKTLEALDFDQLSDAVYVYIADKLGLPFEMTWHLKEID